eukprot:Hpha_TRINITY_DN15816_c4_g2::TRINITY_DN15816_c4_g2_i1::g.187690::m.187690/K02212/MCM4, CDC54; DNA replication licensing factor MCM4
MEADDPSQRSSTPAPAVPLGPPAGTGMYGQLPTSSPVPDRCFTPAPTPPGSQHMPPPSPAQSGVQRTPRRHAGTPLMHGRANATPQGERMAWENPFFDNNDGDSTQASTAGIDRQTPQRGAPKATRTRRGTGSSDTGRRRLFADQPVAGDGLPEEEKFYIWGTDVDLKTFRTKLLGFFQTYENAAGAKHYLHEMEDMYTEESRSCLDINLSHLRQYDEWLADCCCFYPEDTIGFVDDVANDVYKGLIEPQLPVEARDDLQPIYCRLCEFDRVRQMRELQKNELEHLICVKGMVVRVSRRNPELTEAVFRCAQCGETLSVRAERGRVEEPMRCESCAANGKLEIQHVQSTYQDKQFVRLQEAPESTPDGQTPASIQVTVERDLIDAVVPGDRVLLTGVYTAKVLRSGGAAKQNRAVVRTYIKAWHLAKTSRAKHRHNAPEDDAEDYAKRIEATANRADIYDVLRNSLAPDIWGHDDVKMGLLCQLFGGTSKGLTFCSARAEINILLCGDPGVAKSQLLSHVHSVATRGIYTSGKGSTQVGLTAYVVKDAETGEFVLESGALVLSDGGVCCIDEFDKMGDDTRAVLHEVMEQQTVSIARAGIICSLNARASVLAAANPKESKWQRSLSIIDNISIGPTLLSRFDLIYLLLDEQDTVLDRRLSAFLCQMYTKPPPVSTSTDQTQNQHGKADLTYGPDNDKRISASDLTKYVHYARTQARPHLTPDSKASMVDAYLQLRKARGSRNVVTATVRQLESMIRLSEALAKMRLSDTVSIKDVEEAKRLTETALKQSCIDKETGCLITTRADHTGAGAGSLVAIMHAIERVAQKEHLHGKTVAISDLQSKFRDWGEQMVSQDQLASALSMMHSRDAVTVAGNSITFNTKG